MNGAKLFIAVVDDDLSVRVALARLLKANSFEVETYGSAKAFLDSLNLRRPACLVLDLHMPEYSGLDLKHELNRSGIEIPTVMITAYAEPTLERRVSLAGAEAILIKPLNDKTLIESINRAAASH
jgi:FixJ family two-component response regulator